MILSSLSMRPTQGLTSLDRVRQLREEPYTQKEAEAAVGLTTDNDRPEKTAVDSVGGENVRLEEEQKPIEENDDEEYNAFFSVR